MEWQRRGEVLPLQSITHLQTHYQSARQAMQMLFVTSTLQVTFAHVGCFRVEKAGNNKCRTCVQMVTTENALRPECPGVPGKDNLGRLDLVWKTRKGTPRKCKSQSAQRGRKSDIKEGTCP